MSGSPFLDWAVFAVSLFNTMVLLWLGLTVLLSAERRTWGLWLAGGGLLAACAFFVSHTAILGHELVAVSKSIELWWRAGWATLVALPFSWYVLMQWYTGYWDDDDRQPHRRLRTTLTLIVAVTAFLLVLLLTTRALPSYDDAIQLGYSRLVGAHSLPWPIIVYPFYGVFCIGLALRALAHPQPSSRFMGELARRRACPWLTGVSIGLLVVSLLVAAAVGWVVTNGLQRLGSRGFPDAGEVVAWFDLGIASLIGVAIVMLGQAIVAYEVFTGQNLPRRGFSRHWRRVTILAAGYSLVIGWSLVRDLPSIYGLLLTALVMIAFQALLVWQSFGDRERAISQLRPFVRSQGTYGQLLGAESPSDIDTSAVFRALCRDVLDARVAQLVPVGPAATLVGVSLVYPEGREAPPSLIQPLVNQLRETQRAYVDVDPAVYGGAEWAVSLWREQGLIGVLLLGSKTGRGLYMQEEIELAQAAGERLIDLLSSAEMGRRLMVLQRERLAETQIADQRVRRVLHDEVLPKLHATMLMLGTGPETNGTEIPADAAQDPAAQDAAARNAVSLSAVDVLAETHHQIADLLRELPPPRAPEVARWGIVGALQRVVEQDLAGAFDGVHWEIEPAAEARSRQLPQLTADVLFFAAREAVRNAARYGRDKASARSLALKVSLFCDDALVLCVEDDGAGIRPDDSPDRGTGQGLALHSTMMAVVGGSLDIESTLGHGTRVTLMLAGSPAPSETSTRSR